MKRASDEPESPPKRQSATTFADRQYPIELVAFATGRPAGVFPDLAAAAAAFQTTKEEVHLICSGRLFERMLCGYGLRYGRANTQLGPKGPVNQYDTDGNFMCQWRGINMAHKGSGVTYNAVYNLCMRTQNRPMTEILRWRERTANVVLSQYIWVLAEYDYNNRAAEAIDNAIYQRQAEAPAPYAQLEELPLAPLVPEHDADEEQVTPTPSPVMDLHRGGGANEEEAHPPAVVVIDDEDEEYGDEEDDEDDSSYRASTTTPPSTQQLFMDRMPTIDALCEQIDLTWKAVPNRLIEVTIAGASSATQPPYIWKYSAAKLAMVLRITSKYLRSCMMFGRPVRGFLCKPIGDGSGSSTYQPVAVATAHLPVPPYAPAEGSKIIRISRFGREVQIWNHGLNLLAVAMRIGRNTLRYRILDGAAHDGYTFQVIGRMRGGNAVPEGRA